MIDELYINNEKVDMGSSGVNLKFNSNILKDISKVVSNNSYTINLPRTVRNERILKVAGRPTRNDDFPRSIHTGKLYRDGFPIVESCNIHLLSIGSTIEIALIWGNSQALAKLIDDGKNLNELGGTSYDVATWKDYEISDYGADEGFPGLLYADIDFGLKSGETEAFIHPSVRASYIFEKLEQAYGLKVSIPEGRKEIYEHLIFPLTSRNGGKANAVEGEWRGSVFYDAKFNASLPYSYLNFDTIYSATKVDEFIELVQTYLGIEYGFKIKSFKAKRNGKAWILPDFSCKTDTIFVGRVEGKDVTNYGYLEAENQGDGYYRYNAELTFDISEGDEFYIIEVGRTEFSFINKAITVRLIPEEIKKGEFFSLVDNLPPIKTTDYIKTICNVLGLYVSSVGDNLVLTEFEKLEDNKAFAKDWSDKMMGEAENISFQLSDFAQRNYLRYKEDDAVGMTFGGVVKVADKWLDAEGVLSELKFAGSLNNGGRAVVKLYSYNDKGELEYEDTTPRILLEADNNGKARGVFQGLSFAELVPKFYYTYQSIVFMPVVIKAKFRLNASDVRGMDMAVPIYLKQFGKFYVIKEGILDNDNIFEVELIQM